MMFSGKHTGDFLGHPPSNLQISWAGAAFFTAKQSQELPPEHLRISDIWVLGDLHNLHQQLNDAGQARPI